MNFNQFQWALRRYEKLLHDAMERQLGGQMRACVQGSADETGRMACRTSEQRSAI